MSDYFPADNAKKSVKVMVFSSFADLNKYGGLDEQLLPENLKETGVLVSTTTVSTREKLIEESTKYWNCYLSFVLIEDGKVIGYTTYPEKAKTFLPA